MTELTKRELEVLKLLSTGLSNKEIAEILLVTVNTIKAHIRNAFQKLNAKNRTQAAIIYLNDSKRI